MIDGILIIDKEKGITSYDVIRKLKKILDKGQKIGHAGTLDPLASGVLVILLGRATKMMEKIHSYEKVYEAQGEFGYRTDTQDIQGKVIDRDLNTTVFSREDIEHTIDQYLIGDIQQIPPRYSAKQIGGKRAYDLAREGKDFELKPIQVSVSVFEVYEYDYPTFKCKIKCSTGTYIRTLINDLGIKLGTYATMKNLRRVSIGGFNVSEALSSKEISAENRENILRRVINI